MLGMGEAFAKAHKLLVGRSAAYRQGRDAYRRCVMRWQNPFPVKTPEHAAWSGGWDEQLETPANLQAAE